MTPTLQSSVRRIVLGLFPWLSIAGPHTYTVHAANEDGTIDLSPPAGSRLPPLPRVPQWILGGAEVKPALGSAVVVMYLDNDATKPVICSFVPLSASRPDHLTIDVGNDKTIDMGAHAGVINLGGAGAAALAHAAQVIANINALKSAISGAATTPGDGGAAFKAAIVAALGSWPSAVATSKVVAV